MEIRFKPTELPGVLVVEPAVFPDSRGHFLELYHREKYRGHGIEPDFVQDNFSHSAKGVLRGLHFQVRRPQAKLVTALRGEIFDVVVDLRPDSPAFGKWLGVRLSGERKTQIFVPKGFAHGFCVLSETADVHYKCSQLYDPADEGGILWSDPELGIAWPIDRPILSGKDARSGSFREAVSLISKA